MPRNGPTKNELVEALDQINEMAEEALDPENSREDLVRKLKDIADLASGENEEDEDETDEDE